MSDITKIKVDGEPESSYQLYPRNEEFAKRAGGNTGSQSGVQPDWNQNDDTKPDYVKNRPFYTGDPVENMLVEESTLSFTTTGAGFYYAAIPTTIELTAGETYKVSWDGATYECVCESITGYIVIGNPSIIGAGADTGDPFLITPLADDDGTEIYTKDTSASHTMYISGSIAENVQIPDKYISDTFRDVIIAGDPLDWSTNDWTKYYGLYKGGKLLKINAIGSGNSDGYVLSMFCNASSKIFNISVITSDGNIYTTGFNSKDGKSYWSPIYAYDNFYFGYRQTGSDSSDIAREEYALLNSNRINLSFTTKNANETPVTRRVVLEGDKGLILSSSTTGSTKKFKITVDDSGNLTATEVT